MRKTGAILIKSPMNSIAALSGPHAQLRSARFTTKGDVEVVGPLDRFPLWTRVYASQPMVLSGGTLRSSPVAIRPPVVNVTMATDARADFQVLPSTCSREMGVEFRQAPTMECAVPISGQARVSITFNIQEGHLRAPTNAILRTAAPLLGTNSGCLASPTSLKSTPSRAIGVTMRRPERRLNAH